MLNVEPTNPQQIGQFRQSQQVGYTDPRRVSPYYNHSYRGEQKLVRARSQLQTLVADTGICDVLPSMTVHFFRDEVDRGEG